MNESTSNQLNECDLDDSSETYQFDKTSCVVDEKFVPKVEMIFKTLEEAGKFYKHYSKHANFSTKIRNTTRDGEKIKNQLIVCTREGRWKSKISPTLKTNPSAGLNCLARIYVHIMKDVGLDNFQSCFESLTSLLPKGLIRSSWLRPSLIVLTLMHVPVIASIPFNNIRTKLKAMGMRSHSN
ncbi:hypothetical protein AHAS_Ahas04G0125900 [Arachis hypogaea]